MFYGFRLSCIAVPYFGTFLSAEGKLTCLNSIGPTITDHMQTACLGNIYEFVKHRTENVLN
jgi:hypothetical protein